MLNTEVLVQSRLGSNVFGPVPLTNWWGSLGTFRDVFDPRVQYDPYGQRWIAAALVNSRSSTSSVLLAVSQTSNPTGSWYYHKIRVDPQGIAYADYPNLGFNRQWIAVSVNVYVGSTPSFARARCYLFNRTNLYTGGSNYASVLFENSFEGGPFTVVPAVTYDTNVSTLFLLTHRIAPRTNESGEVEGLLRLRTVSGPVEQPVLSTNEVYAANSAWAFLQDSPYPNIGPQLNATNQAGSQIPLHLGDGRLQNVIFRNGHLWATHTVFLPPTNVTRSAVQWWQLATNGAVRQVGRIEDKSNVLFYAYPSIAVNQFNDVLIGFSTFASTQYARASYAFRAFYDAPGTTRTAAALKSGEGRYWYAYWDFRNRWGDYSATWVDPINNYDFWTIQEYSLPEFGNATSYITNYSGRWATWWGRVNVAMPTNDAFTAAVQLSGSTGSATGTVLRATRELGEPNHLNTSHGSIWYTWTAPTNGSVAFDTFGSADGLDTTMAVYTGTSVSNLTLVASNDNGNARLQSRLAFAASAETAYHVAVDAMNPNGEQATIVTVNWLQHAAPFITLQPCSTNVITSNSVTFTVGAAGVAPLAYQWRKETDDLDGATNTSYTIGSAQSNDAGNYSVLVTNYGGSLTSSVAVLGVYPNAIATLGSYGSDTNEFRFTVNGVPGYSYIVEAATNLGDTNPGAWTAILTNAASFSFTNLISTNPFYRFYRARYD